MKSVYNYKTMQTCRYIVVELIWKLLDKINKTGVIIKEGLQLLNLFLAFGYNFLNMYGGLLGVLRCEN
ncbi:hypothetical protein Hanom_Chr16g01500951 [Helianthus anomalus]